MGVFNGLVQKHVLLYELRRAHVCWSSNLMRYIVFEMLLRYSNKIMYKDVMIKKRTLIEFE